MRTDDLFLSDDDSTGLPGQTHRLDVAFLEQLRSGTVEGIDDVEATIAVLDLVHDNLTLFGTDGTQKVNEPDMTAALKSLKSLLQRVGIAADIPWRDYAGFKAYWLRNRASGSWAARRSILFDVFDPVREELDRMEAAQFRGILAEGINSVEVTGWPLVDEEIRELRRRFRTATTPQDYRAVGGHCVGVLEALSAAVYDEDRHLREGEEFPPIAKTKQRLGRFIEDALAGSSNAEIRSLTTKSVEAAQMVKHRATTTRRDAGIAADTVILLANILRRIDEP